LRLFTEKTAVLAEVVVTLCFETLLSELHQLDEEIWLLPPTVQKELVSEPCVATLLYHLELRFHVKLAPKHPLEEEY